MLKILTMFLIVLGGGAADGADEAAVEPRYIFFMRSGDAGWHQDRPESFTRNGFDEVADTLAVPDNPALRVGVTTAFSYMETDVAVLKKSLQALLDASEASGVPVLVTLDGQNWWETRPDLWNWWDPDLPGYDPANAYNVEWTDWTPASAVKIGWRNWGSQIRVRPAPNLSSPKLVGEHVARLQALVPVITAWYNQLPADRKYLFGGVKVGWEAGIGYNAFHYPDGNRCIEQWPDDPSHDPTSGLDLSKGLAGSCAQLGYAAVKTAGIKDHGVITREDIAEVTRRYLERLARTTNEAGIPKSKVFAHQGGTYPPWDKHIPFGPAVNAWSVPGWTFYGTDPADADGLAETLEQAPREEWAAAEWWWGAPDKDTWKDHFLRTLRFRNCRHIAVYNWDCGFRFKVEQAGHEAVREVVADWTE